MVTNNKTCAVCGKTYTYCSGCGFQEPSYRRSMCSESCRDIYRTLSAYNMNKIDDQEAIKKLKACDLSNLENFTEKIKKEVKDILAKEIKKEDKKEPEIKKLVAAPTPVKQPLPAPKPNAPKKENTAFKNVSDALGVEVKK